MQNVVCSVLEPVKSKTFKIMFAASLLNTAFMIRAKTDQPGFGKIGMSS